MAHQEGIIVEFHQLGNSVKVTAIDTATMQEAIIIGPVSATQEQLTQLAIRKLNYVMGKTSDV